MRKKTKFLEQSQQDDAMPIKDKTINVRAFVEKLQKYSITFSQHPKFYNFYDPREIIPDFLQVFENRFIPRRNLDRVRFKCNCTVINRQPLPVNGFVELTDTRV